LHLQAIKGLDHTHIYIWVSRSVFGFQISR
jgi:hypothetical protein